MCKHQVLTNQINPFHNILLHNETELIISKIIPHYRTLTSKPVTLKSPHYFLGSEFLDRNSSELQRSLHSDTHRERSTSLDQELSLKMWTKRSGETRFWSEMRDKTKARQRGKNADEGKEIEKKRWKLTQISIFLPSVQYPKGDPLEHKIPPFYQQHTALLIK